MSYKMNVGDTEYGGFREGDRVLINAGEEDEYSRYFLGIPMPIRAARCAPGEPRTGRVGGFVLDGMSGREEPVVVVIYDIASRVGKIIAPFLIGELTHISEEAADFLSAPLPGDNE